MTTSLKNTQAAQFVLRAQAQNQRKVADSFRHLSTGKRVSRAADDAAGLGVAENLDAQRMSTKAAIRNINDGLSVNSVVEGSLRNVGDLIKRMRELAVQAASETLNSDERTYINTEFQAIGSEVQRIKSNTEFNGTSLQANAIQVQTGIHNDANNSLTLSSKDISGGGSVYILGTSDLDVVTYKWAYAINAINTPGTHSFIGFNENGSIRDLYDVAGNIKNATGAEVCGWAGGAGTTLTSNQDLVDRMNETFRNSKIYADPVNWDPWKYRASLNNTGNRIVIQRFGDDKDLLTGVSTYAPSTLFGVPTESVETAAADFTSAGALWSVDTLENARDTLDFIDFYIEQNNENLAQVGAETNRLLSALSTSEANYELLSSATSQIVDSDLAFETATLANNQIKSQASTEVLQDLHNHARSILKLIP